MAKAKSPARPAKSQGAKNQGAKAAAPSKRPPAKAAVKATPKAPAAKAPPRKDRDESAQTKLDWSATIKKALQDKGGQPSWPGSGDAWKRKNKI